MCANVCPYYTCDKWQGQKVQIYTVYLFLNAHVRVFEEISGQCQDTDQVPCVYSLLHTLRF